MKPKINYNILNSNNYNVLRISNGLMSSYLN